MAWASVGTLGTGTHNSSAASWTLTTSANLEAGNVGVLWISVDNRGTTDGDLREVSSVVDGAGNTWISLGEYTNGQGAQNAGVTSALWATVADTQLDSGGTITITLRNAKTAKVASAWEFSFDGTDISVYAVQQVVGDAADPAAITISGIASAEYLWLHLFGVENDADTYTQDADYSSITAANVGTGAAGMSVYGGFRVYTGTTDTVDAAFATAADHVQLLIALQEIPVGGAGIVGELNRGSVVWTADNSDPLSGGWTETANAYFEPGNLNTHPPKDPPWDSSANSLRMKLDTGLPSGGEFPASTQDTIYTTTTQNAGEYVLEWYEVEHDVGTRVVNVYSDTSETLVATLTGTVTNLGETTWFRVTLPFTHTGNDIKVEVVYTAPASGAESGIKMQGIRVRQRYGLANITLTGTGTVTTPASPGSVLPAKVVLREELVDEVKLREEPLR